MILLKYLFTTQKVQVNMDSTKCVICYENKAELFCVDCKQSSGVCWRCYMTLNKNKYGEDGEYAEPINCVICKKYMDYAAFVYSFNMDVDDLECLLWNVPEEKRYKLRDLVGDNSDILIPKHER